MVMNKYPSSNETMRIKSLAFPLTFLLIGGIAVWIQLYMTPHGAGVSPDSVKYISAARNFIDGNGLMHLGNDGGLVPLTLWPPLYPLLLSTGSLFDLDPWEVGRYLNAIAFGINILVFQGLIYRASDRNVFATFLGGIVMIFSPIILEVHTWIWTEPVAIFLGFSSLILLDRFIRFGKNVDLVGIGLLLSMGMLIRYAAIVFPLTVGLIIYIFPRRIKLWERSKRLLIILLFIAIPQLILMLRNRGLETGIVGRTFRIDPTPLGWMTEDIIDVIRSWTVPGRIEPNPANTVAVLILFFWLVMTSMILFKQKRIIKGDISSALIVPLSLFIFTLLSIIPIILVNLLFSPGVHVDKRILSLAYCSGTLLSIILYTIELSNLSKDGSILKDRRKIYSLLPMFAIAGAFLLIIVMNAIHATDWIRNAHSDGRGFAHYGWQESKVIDYIDEKDNLPTMISNVPEVIYFFTGKRAVMMPASTSEIEEVARSFEIGDHQDSPNFVWIVYFRTPLRRHSVPSEVQISQELEVFPVYGWDEGSIYSLELD
jgi:hypothetical protein